jgi:hypothetical protein
MMMSLETPETCRGWRNILVLRISCASSWFSYTRLYRDAIKLTIYLKYFDTKPLCVQHFLWRSQSSRWFTPFHTFVLLQLLKTVSNCFADRSISSTRTVEISLYSYSKFVFDKPNDGLCLSLLSRHRVELRQWQCFLLQVKPFSACNFEIACLRNLF